MKRLSQRCCKGYVDYVHVVPRLLNTQNQALSAVSEHSRNRMAENLHKLLQSSGRVPPELQLNSGEVEWPKERFNSGNVDICKGRYLHSEDVRIKVVRSVNMKDENAVRVSLPGADPKYPP